MKGPRLSKICQKAVAMDGPKDGPLVRQWYVDLGSLLEQLVQLYMLYLYLTIHQRDPTNGLWAQRLSIGEGSSVRHAKSVKLLPTWGVLLKYTPILLRIYVDNFSVYYLY